MQFLFLLINTIIHLLISLYCYFCLLCRSIDELVRELNQWLGDIISIKYSLQQYQQQQQQLQITDDTSSYGFEAESNKDNGFDKASNSCRTAENSEHPSITTAEQKLAVLAAIEEARANSASLIATAQKQVDELALKLCKVCTL